MPIEVGGLARHRYLEAKCPREENQEDGRGTINDSIEEISDPILEYNQRNDPVIEVNELQC